MKSKHLAAAIVLSTLLVTSVAGATSRSPVSIRIKLDATTVMAGRSIHGVATLTNSSAKTIVVNACAEDGWLDVGLSNKTVWYQPISGAVACNPTVKLKPGANRFLINVATTYQVCQVHGTPRCTKTGAPALPKGTYRVVVITAGLPKGTHTAANAPVILR